MSVNSTNQAIPRPQRWDEPFDPDMSESEVARLLQLEPFASMDAKAFSKNVPLNGLLRNDCRLLDLQAGDIIVREGDYGSSAFLILSGQALVSMKKLPDQLLGRRTRKKSDWLTVLLNQWRTPKYPEVRDYENTETLTSEDVGTRNDGEQTRVFLHDVPRVLGPHESIELQRGEIFGEISALTRSPRSATVIAKGPTTLLEIRWQGFRELLNRHPALREHVERLYRDNSLRSHLREIKLFQDLEPMELEQIADATRFESFGEFRWNRKFKSTQKKDIAERILEEEIIAREGDPVDGLIMIRNGFARLSRSYGAGHQTIAYLGRGQTFGLRELAHNWKTGQQRPWMLSLRALGHVDILRIPAEVIHQSVLAKLDPQALPPPLPPELPGQSNRQDRRLVDRNAAVDRPLLEFLVDKRYVNGTSTMLIDLDRCTRCDDCIRACAATHDNNPRFNRSGEIHDRWMIANACMHCQDPVCMIGCPTGAIGRDAETGSVVINDQTCIGCSMCANSCPYSNIQMVEINTPQGLPIVDVDSGRPIQKATKCDLCHDHSGGPACQRACPHDALFRVDLSSECDWEGMKFGI